MPYGVILVLLRVQVPLLSVKPIRSHCDDDHPMGTWEPIIPVRLGDEVPMQPTVPLQKQDRPDISLDTAGFHQFSTRQFCPIYFWSLLTMIICFLVSGFHIPVSRRGQRISEQKRSQRFPPKRDAAWCVFAGGRRGRKKTEYDPRGIYLGKMGQVERSELPCLSKGVTRDVYIPRCQRMRGGRLSLQNPFPFQEGSKIA